MGFRAVALPVLALLLVACDSERQAASTQQLQSSSGESAQNRQYRIQVNAGDALTAVHDASKREEIVLLELCSDKIAFTALISRRKYEEVMALRPPTYIKHEGLEYL